MALNKSVSIITYLIDILKHYDFGYYTLDDMIDFLKNKNFNFIVDDIYIYKGNKEYLKEKIMEYDKLLIKNVNIYNFLENTINECKIDTNTKDLLFKECKKIIDAKNNDLIETNKINEKNRFLDHLIKKKFLNTNYFFSGTKCKFSYIEKKNENEYLYLCEYKKSLFNSNHDTVKIYEIKIKLTK